MEFITLTKADPDFENYLRGTFSHTHRALPIETYHPQTARERVTFRVLPIAQLDTPAWWQVYFWACRPELLGLTLGPAMAAWLNRREWLGQWTRWPSWFALLGLFFLHTGVFLLNDVQDHMRGSDRLNRRRGSQVIQRGWVTAGAMQKWAWVNIALAIVFALPAFFHTPGPLTAVCAVAALCIGLIIQNKFTRFGISDLALACLFGPLLTVGIALASFAAWNVRDLVLGIGFGALTAWVFQVRQFENLFRSKAEGIRTFLGFWDFDRARMMGIGEGVFLVMLHFLNAVYLGIPLGFLLLLPLVCAPLIYTLWCLGRASSPLSSSLIHSQRHALMSDLALTSWWIAALGFTWL